MPRCVSRKRRARRDRRCGRAVVSLALLGEERMASRKVVHIIGTGTIGEPLIGLFADKKDSLGFDEVTFHKRTPLLTDKTKVTSLIKRGARLACDDSARQGFRELGIEPAYEHHEALRQATVVNDCTPSDVGLQNKK